MAWRAKPNGQVAASRLGAPRELSTNACIWQHDAREEVRPLAVLVLDARRGAPICGFTTDMGTELGLGDFAVSDISTLLPPWAASGREGDGRKGLQVDTFGILPDMDIGDEPRDIEAFSPSRVFPEALCATGAQHIMHNLSWLRDTRLERFDFWLDGAKHLVTLLHYRHHRERFVERCVRGSTCEQYAHLFRKGIPLIIGWRWGNIVQVVEALLPLQVALRQTFRVAAFGGNAVQAGAEDRSKAEQGRMDASAVE